MKSVLITFAFGLLAASGIFAQGPLPPPTGPPVASMKTLDQIEPRTPIRGTTATVPTTDSYIIIKSGSYYLTGNITVTTDINVIVVADQVNNVTIDLNGFTIESTLTSAGTGSAIVFEGKSSGSRICNGNISSGSLYDVGSNVLNKKGFNSGISSVEVKLTSSTISGVNVKGVSNIGIAFGNGCLVENCTVSDCWQGIKAGYDDVGTEGEGGTIVRGCSVRKCTGIGIRARVVESSEAFGYGGVAIDSYTALNCIATSVNNSGMETSQATNCIGTSTNGPGLSAGNATNCRGQTATGQFGLSGLSATNAAFCVGTSTTGDGLLAASTASNCKGTSTSKTGLAAGTVSVPGTASNCIGTSSTSTGLYSSSNAAFCTGISTSGDGLVAATNASDCTGKSDSKTGLAASTNASNCTGTSNTSTGLYAGANAINCTGTTSSTTAGVTGLFAVATANTCQGNSGAGATALKAAIAIGCTFNGGILVVPVGKSFNM